MLNQKGFTFTIIVITVVLTAIGAIVINKSTKPKLNIQTNTQKEASPSALIASSSASPSPSATSTPSAPIESGSAKPKSSPIVKDSPPPAAPVVNNNPPGSGFSSQTVSVDGQNYRVSIIAADLNSTKVIVDTASDSDCTKDCPVLSLGDYVSRNGAWAGINGGYFCPADYASCSEKKNSFDTLVMNKNKHYFNSDNNVYSTVPAAIFSPGGARFVGQSSQWGRDTGVDAVIANYPLLVSGNNVNFTEAPNEPKFGGAASRTFIAAKGNMVYIGIVHGVSMGQSAKVLQAMGMGEALNLDQGGSTALWFGGSYKAGPGRGIPNAILFVNR